MNDRPAPLISIIVAVFNGKATLQQCIDSVAQQTWPNRELIVIDGGSTDGTVELLNANREKIAYWISEPDRGIFNAWNKGLAHANGEWICFLGADDHLWDARVLERIAAQLDRIPPGIRVAYGQIMMLGAEGQQLYTVGAPWEEAGELFKQYMSIPHPAVMHRKSLFERHGKFDESFHIAGDYEFLLRELKTGVAVFIPDIIVIGMRAGGISMHSGMRCGHCGSRPRAAHAWTAFAGALPEEGDVQGGDAPAVMEGARGQVRAKAARSAQAFEGIAAPLDEDLTADEDIVHQSV